MWIIKNMFTIYSYTTNAQTEFAMNMIDVLIIFWIIIYLIYFLSREQRGRNCTVVTCTKRFVYNQLLPQSYVIHILKNVCTQKSCEYCTLPLVVVISAVYYICSISLNTFCCFWLFHILMPYNIFFFVYFIFISLIALYFLHSTSVLSFYIDVVLTLSIPRKFYTTYWMHSHGYQIW